jgi:sugar phosphate isomerase/epimerase
MTALLEPFDRDFHRRFLFGPTSECVELVERLKSEGHELRIQLDIAHVRLSGEQFDDALHTCRPYLGHVHLGNCVMHGDRADPFFGDRHPPIGYSNGEINDKDLCNVFKSLLEAGYLDRQRRPTLVIEAQPFPGRTPEQTIDDQLARLERAWKDV